MVCLCYGYLVIDLELSTSKQDRLRTDTLNYFDQQSPDKENMSDDDDADSVESLHCIRSISPPGQGRKLRD